MALTDTLLTRKKVIQFGLEDSKGTEVATDTDLYCYDINIAPAESAQARKGAGKYMGNEQSPILEDYTGVCSFTTELYETGAGGLHAGLAELIQACGFKKTSEVYSLSSSPADHKTLTIEVFEDGLKKAVYGAMGTVRFTGEVGKRMMLEFEFRGVWKTPVDAAMPAFSPTIGTPIKIGGGSFTVDTDAIKIANFTFDPQVNLAANYDANADHGIAYYHITDNDPIIEIDPQMHLVADYDYYGKLQAGTSAAVALAVGISDTLTFAFPAVAFRQANPGDRDGLAVYELVGQCNHDSGDDAATLTVTL